MKATQVLRDLGQSLWLDNITRNLLRTGVLRRYIDELSVTGLTSNPTIFDHAIGSRRSYDTTRNRRRLDRPARRARDCSSTSRWRISAAGRGSVRDRSTAHRTGGRLGCRWKSHLCSRYDTSRRLREAKALHGRANRPISSSRFPAPRKGCLRSRRRSSPAYRSTSLCCSPPTSHVSVRRLHERVGRRVAAGLSPNIRSVASVFVSRWDVAVAAKVPAATQQPARHSRRKRSYKAYLDVLSSPRWMRACNVGARPQRLLSACRHRGSECASDIALRLRPRTRPSR